MALQVNLVRSLHLCKEAKITLKSTTDSGSYRCIGLDTKREAGKRYLWSIYLANLFSKSLCYFLNMPVNITQRGRRMPCKNWVSFQLLRTFNP